MSEINYKHNPKLTPNARELRKNMTKEEKQLWYNYLRKCKVRFLRQKVIDNYIVDFYCSKLNLVIELDGSHHYEDKGLKYDKIGTEKLALSLRKYFQRLSFAKKMENRFLQVQKIFL